MSCCWTATLYDQSDGRTPQPLSRPGSMFAPTNWLEPNSTLLMPPHSPLAAGLVSTQSGVKLLFASAHVRVTLGLPNAAAAPPGMRSDGLALDARLPTLAPWRYLPALAFSAVLPVPNTSYAAPTRGVM